MRGSAVASMMAAALVVAGCGTTDEAAKLSSQAGRAQGDVLEIVCGEHGIAVDDDTVAVRADGLHVRVTHQGRDHRYVLSGTDHTIAVSLPGIGGIRQEAITYAAPGAYELWCAGQDDEAPGGRPTVDVVVADLDGLWHAAPPFGCDQVEQIIDHEPGLDLGRVEPGALVEAAERALRRERLLDDGMPLVAVGYEDAPDGLVGVRDDGAAVSFHVSRDDQGNTRVGLSSTCAVVGD